jgi:hypothetical protein
MNTYARPLALGIPLLFLLFIHHEGWENFWFESAACIILTPLIYTKFLPTALSAQAIPLLRGSPLLCFLITLGPLILFAITMGLGVRGWRKRHALASLAGLGLTLLLIGVYLVMKPHGVTMG